MLAPSIFNHTGRNLFGNWFDVGFPEMESTFFRNDSLMRTDVKETDTGYELTMDLPGLGREDVKASLEDGYLTVTAEKHHSKDEKDDQGHYIRRERASGRMSRSFYVGDQVTQEDIHAKFENGTLVLDVPKKNEAQTETGRLIEIE